jgi:hypothetical protein
MFNTRRLLSLAVVLLLLFVLVPLALAQEGNTVDVTLIDGQINMVDSLPTGPTTFNITNEGTKEHSFEIEGNGIEEALEPTLQPGESGTLEVDLQPGTYEVYCPVGDHREMGMTMQLTVTGEGAGTTPGTEPQTVPEATSEAAEAQAVPEATPEAAQAEAQAAPEATPEAAQEQPAALPATGGVLSPWSGILLLGLGLLVLIGGLSLALARRTR